MRGGSMHIIQMHHTQNVITLATYQVTIWNHCPTKYVYCAEGDNNMPGHNGQSS